jgi:hypothetical protein
MGKNLQPYVPSGTPGTLHLPHGIPEALDHSVDEAYHRHHVAAQAGPTI